MELSEQDFQPVDRSLMRHLLKQSTHKQREALPGIHCRNATVYTYKKWTGKRIKYKVGNITQGTVNMKQTQRFADRRWFHYTQCNATNANSNICFVSATRNSTQDLYILYPLEQDQIWPVFHPMLLLNYNKNGNNLPCICFNCAQGGLYYKVVAKYIAPMHTHIISTQSL